MTVSHFIRYSWMTKIEGLLNSSDSSSVHEGRIKIVNDRWNKILHTQVQLTQPR